MAFTQQQTEALGKPLDRRVVKQRPAGDRSGQVDYLEGHFVIAQLNRIFGFDGAEGAVRRFWSHVDTSGACWVWTASTNGAGYGQLYYYRDGRRHRIYAHRLAYIIYRGVIPSGLCVCHQCDTPACIRPDHLFLGTVGDNNRDAITKGRPIGWPHPMGAAHPRARLTEQQVHEIRARRANGETLKDLGAAFGVHLGTIHAVVQRKNWKSVS